MVEAPNRPATLARVMDIVNEYFHRFYPADRGWEKFDPAEWRGGVWQKWKGPISDTIFPLIKCADGFEMSVQGHFGAYCYPCGDFEDCYTEVEIHLSKSETLLNAFADDGRAGVDHPVGNVPVALVVRIIEKHGGLAP